MITLGEWLPDQPDTQNAGVTVAKNVIPAAQGYRSMNDFIAYSEAATAKIKGIFAAKDADGNAKLFAGDEGKLYLHNSGTNALDDISKSGTPAYDLSSSEFWRFTQFGNDVIAVGGIGEEPQKFTLGTDSVFSNLGGTPPKADFIATVRDFVWVANLDSGSGRQPFRCQWSAFNDADSWTSGTNQSDFQDLPDSGAITGLVGGEYCTILTERAIYRATYAGLPLVWQFDKIDSQRGCAFSGSVCNIGSMVFYLADDGFYSFNGQQSQPIGSEKVNDFFINDFDSNYEERMTAAVDPINEVAMWSYTSTQSPTGQPDKILIYNYVLNKWALAEIEADLLAPMFTAGYTTESLANIDTLVDNLDQVVDSRQFTGGQYIFGGAYDDKIYSFTGSPLAATIETGEAALSAGSHSLVNRLYVYHENGSVTAEIGTRNTQTATPSYSSASSPNDDGFVPTRASGRYHRARLNFSGNWSKAQGIDIEATKTGRR